MIGGAGLGFYCLLLSMTKPSFSSNDLISESSFPVTMSEVCEETEDTQSLNRFRCRISVMVSASSDSMSMTGRMRTRLMVWNQS